MSINDELAKIIGRLFTSPELVGLVAGRISSEFPDTWPELALPCIIIGTLGGQTSAHGVIVRRKLHVYAYGKTSAEAAEVYEHARKALSGGGKPLTLSCTVRSLYESDSPLSGFASDNCGHWYRGEYKYTAINAS